MTSWDPSGPYDPSRPAEPYSGPPASGPPPYGQPSYGQPAYGQPPYGQPAYGPPPYGMPPPGVPPYGMPPPGAPPYGQHPYGQMPPPVVGFWAAPVPGGRLASMGARFGGFLLDVLIIFIPVLIVALALGAYDTHVTCTGFGTCTRSTDGGKVATVYLVDAVLTFAYFSYFVGVRGQTLGQRVSNIRVVDVRTGAPIGPGRAALRHLVLSLTGALCTLGYWSPFFDSTRRQGWHDKASSSVVIPSDAPPAAPPGAPPHYPS